MSEAKDRDRPLVASALFVLMAKTTIESMRLVTIVAAATTAITKNNERAYPSPIIAILVSSSFPTKAINPLQYKITGAIAYVV